MLLIDITAEELLKIAEILEVDYLGPAADSQVPSRHLDSFITNDLWSLSCCREKKGSKPISIILLIDTGSPNTFLCEKAMEALVGKAGCNIGTMMTVMIYSDTVITCHVSRHDKHFSDVNVLGFLVKKTFSLFIDEFYTKDTFQLTF